MQKNKKFILLSIIFTIYTSIFYTVTSIAQESIAQDNNEITINETTTDNKNINNETEALNGVQNDTLIETQNGEQDKSESSQEKNKTQSSKEQNKQSKQSKIHNNNDNNNIKAKSILKDKKRIIIKLKKDKNKKFNDLPTPSNEGNLINNIQIIGNNRIPISTIIVSSGVIIGSKYGTNSMNNIVKSVYNSGFFKDVTVDFNNGALIIHVIENPTVNLVAFEGNKKINDKDMLKMIKMKKRTIYSLNNMNQDLRTIEASYQQMGYFNVNIQPKLVQLSDNRVDVVYVIRENRKAKIAKIAFIGNTEVQNSELQEVILSKEYAWYRLLSNKDVYEQNRLMMDQDMIKRYYMALGYIDFKMLNVISEISQQKDAFVITFQIYEGKRYKVNDVEVVVKSGITGLDTSKIKSIIPIQNGNIYNQEIINASLDKVKKYVGSIGYAFAKVDAQLQRVPVTNNTNDNKNNKNTNYHTVNIKFSVSEGGKIYVNKININDNVRTLDNVIRREMRLSEGDSFDSDAFERSRVNIENLGYFSDVKMEIKETNVPDKADIDISVEERPTGSLNPYIGYSSADGMMGGIKLSENNLLGTGKISSLEFKKDKYDTDFDFSFTDPYFKDKNLSAGFDLFFKKSITASHLKHPDKSNDNGKSYKKQTLGGMLRMGYNINDSFIHSLRYLVKHDNVENMKNNTSPILKSAAGKYLTSSVGQSLMYDRRDSRINPTYGYFVKLDQDIAGIFGDSKYIRNKITASYYYPIYKREVVLNLVFKAGNITGIAGNDVNIIDNFNLSDDVRGFGLNGIGPRTNVGDALGGKNFYSATAEVNFPMGLPKELKIKGAVFFDAASLFGVDIKNDIKGTPDIKCNSDKANGKTCLYYDDNKIRSSYGVGLIWDSPLGGIIRLDYGWALSKTAYDQPYRFRFSLSKEF